MGRNFKFSRHAIERMDKRRIPVSAVAATLAHGRHAYSRGALFFAIGRREVDSWQSKGVNLTPHKNIQVVCSPDGTILTVYRSSDFRALKK